MCEYDRHIRRLDEIDNIESYHQLHITENNVDIMQNLRKDRYKHMKSLEEIQNNLDKMQIDIGKSM
ncbi:MAG: hypothetical protein KAG14_05175, partial [Mycoplasmataceae bacterium]|nr:hypothetical protein [Mycoplasmataceae bacterium]